MKWGGVFSDGGKYLQFKLFLFCPSLSFCIFFFGGEGFFDLLINFTTYIMVVSSFRMWKLKSVILPFSFSSIFLTDSFCYHGNILFTIFVGHPLACIISFHNSTCVVGWNIILSIKSYDTKWNLKKCIVDFSFLLW